MKRYNLLFMITGFVLCMSFYEGAAQSNARIDKLRSEMRRLEKEIDTRKNRERSILEQVEDVEREIGLRTRLLGQLNLEVRSREKEIVKAETRLSDALKSHDNLKAVIRKRVISMYKRGRYSSWEVLVSLSSWNQALVWMRYQQRIIDNDRRNLRQLRQRQNQIRDERNQIENELKAKARLVSEAQRQRRKSENKKKTHQRLLVNVRQDKIALQEQLRKSRIALNEAIRKKIREDKQERKAANTKSRVTQFAKLKGRLDWPVRGKVVTRYGRHRDPVLKIETENLGIDIQGKAGESVRVVCEGEVKWVTWQRGVGNLVLVDHGSNYWTVYGNLDQVLVEAGDQLIMHEIIGQVGSNQSLAGSLCHFQVWQDDQHKNPLHWLKK